ncbi:MAG: hypothetical protein Q7S02_06290 [bacterium]|nr:hypothetical protein [bacterium]
MRIRIVAVAIGIAAALTATTFLWRQVFPFRDHLAAFLPAGTIAYAHANLTGGVRRGIALHISNLESQIGQPLVDALTTALRSPDVRELGLVWFQPDRHAPILGIMVGQRTSARPDVIGPSSIVIAGTELRVIVIRMRIDQMSVDAPPEIAAVLPSLQRSPLQIVVRPRALPIPALEASAYRMPEIMTATGTVDQRGFTVRSDSGRSFFDRHRVISLLAPPRVGSMQILNIPVRALAAEIAAPTHSELLAVLTGALPDAADIIMDSTGVAVHLAHTDLQHERTRAVLQTIAARVWPAVRQRMLDGEPAEVAVADPSSVRMAPTSTGRWVIERAGEPVAAGAVRGDGFVIATSASLLEATMSPTRTVLRIPGRCVQPSPSDNGIIAVIPIHPQLVAVFAISRDGSGYSICGGDRGN